MRVSIQAGAIDAETEHSAFAKAHTEYGALVSFTGRCREMSRVGPVDAVEIEHYPGFTEAVIESHLAGPPFNDLIDVLVIHRVGRIAPGEAIVVAAALSQHRASAFKAVEKIMDFLKTDAPFWKREIVGGEARWIEPTADDRRRGQP